MSGKGSGTDPELHEVRFFLSIENNTEKLSLSTDDGRDLPFLGNLGSGRSEERRPGRVSELEIETGRHGLVGLSSVERLVHLDLLDGSSDLGGSALTDVLLVGTLSTVADLVGAVVVSSLKVAPNGSVSHVLLVARGHLLDSAPRVNLVGVGVSSRSVVLSTSGSSEASSLGGNNELSSFGGRSETKSTGTHAELKEISLTESVKSDTVELGTLSNDVLGSPGLRSVSNASEEVSVSRVSEFQGETGRHGSEFCGAGAFAAIERFVHSDLSDISINLLGLAGTHLRLTRNAGT